MSYLDSRSGRTDPVRPPEITTVIQVKVDIRGNLVKTVRIQPRAKLLLESLRDIGYSLDTALADVIDNAVAADATHISILANAVPPEVRIGILDNGRGMTEEELVDAMRPGSRSPLEERVAADLGRFGLGLKTASFSQCRRLTVVTRKAGKISAARWDLDRVARTDDWVIEIPDCSPSGPMAQI